METSFMIGFTIGSLLVLAGSIWMFVDAKRHGMGGAQWLVFGILFFALALPLYLMKRSQTIALERQLAAVRRN